MTSGWSESIVILFSLLLTSVPYITALKRICSVLNQIPSSPNIYYSELYNLIFVMYYTWMVCAKSSQCCLMHNHKF